MKRGFWKRLTSTAMIAGLLLTTTPFAAMAANDWETSWAKTTIGSWLDRGLVKGYEDGSFRPEAPVTRGEFVTMINHSLGLAKTASIDFKDVAKEDWYYNDLTIAAGNAYVNGYEDGRFGANDNVTREQAATMLQKASGLKEAAAVTGQFTDAGKIPSWAQGAVYATVQQGYFNGYPDGTFGGSQPLTRAEAVTILDRAAKASVTKEDTKIEQAGTVVKEQTIQGNLIICETVGDGSVTIQNTTIQGNILVNGGGANSIHLKDCVVNGTVYMGYNKVRLVAQGNTNIDTVVFQKAGKLDADQWKGKIGKVEISKGIALTDTIQINAPVTTMALQGNADVKINAAVTSIVIEPEAKGAKLELASNAKIDSIEANAAIAITGSGKINTLQANASGITTQVKPNKTNVSSNTTAPSVNTSGSGGSSGGSSSGGSSGGNTQKELKIADFVLLGSDTMKVKLNTSTANAKISIKEAETGKEIVVEHMRLEDDGYYYIYTAPNAISKDGGYTLTVSASGYTAVDYPFKGSDMWEYFGQGRVISSLTDTGRNQLVVTLDDQALEGVTFEVLENGTNILERAVYGTDENNKTIYLLDLTKEVEGGKNYQINLEKEGYHPNSLYYVPVSTVTIQNKEMNREIACGEGVEEYIFLNVEINPSNATNKGLTCVIEDEDIVSLDGVGNNSYRLVNGVKEGSTTVKIVSEDGGVFDEITITAKKKQVESLTSVGGDRVLAAPGGTGVFMVEVDAYAYNKELTWEVADESIATLTPSEYDGYKQCQVKGVAPGITTVTVTTTDGSNKSISFPVAIYEGKLVFDNSSVVNNTISKDGGEQKIWVEITPEEAITGVTGNGLFKWEKYEWRTTTPELITLKKSTNACTIVPTGQTGTATLIFEGRTDFRNQMVTIEMEIEITE